MQVALGLGELWVAEALGAAVELGAVELPPPVAVGRGEVREAERDADGEADAEAEGLAECFFARWCPEADADGSAVALVPVGT